MRGTKTPSGLDSAGLCLVLLASLALVSAQGSCEGDTDCSGKYPCCSKFGYCGDGPGYCTDQDQPQEKELPPLDYPDQEVEVFVGAPDTNTTTGCYLPHTELVGGDLPLQAGGGGVEVDPPQAESCMARCEANPLCLWFTFHTESKLCFLKSRREFLRRRSKGGVGGNFTSGATFEDGCVKEPACLSPYTAFRHQCLHFSPNPDNIVKARLYCYNTGGVLPYDFDGYHSSDETDETLFWLNFNPESEKCFACRLGSRGVTPLPCETRLSFACQRKPLFPIPPPPRPEIIDLVPKKKKKKVLDNRIRFAPVLPVSRPHWVRRLSHVTPLSLPVSQPNIHSFNPYLRFWKGLVKK